MVEAVVGMLKIGLAVGLVIAWGSVLIPPVIRLLGGVNRSSDTIGAFRNNMSLLGGSRPQSANGWSASPAMGVSVQRRQRQMAKKRRRDILVGLLGAAGVTLLLGLVLGGVAWGLFALSAVLLGSYVALLWSVQQAHLERRKKVAYLPQGSAPAAPRSALRPVHTAHN